MVDNQDFTADIEKQIREKMMPKKDKVVEMTEKGE